MWGVVAKGVARFIGVSSVPVLSWACKFVCVAFGAFGVRPDKAARWSWIVGCEYVFAVRLMLLCRASLLTTVIGVLDAWQP